MLMYEIWSLGHKPFEGNNAINEVDIIRMLSTQLLEISFCTSQYTKYCYATQFLFTYRLLILIDTGYRLPPPPGCPRAVYQIMMDCW